MPARGIPTPRNAQESQSWWPLEGARLLTQLAVDGGHPSLVVAIARGLRKMVEPLQVVRRQLDADRGGVLLEVSTPLRARNRDEVVSLCEDPSDCQLGRGHALLGRDLLDLGDQIAVGLEILPREARAPTAEVVLVQLLRGAEPAREEAATERRVRDEADPKLAAGAKDLGLRIARPQRVLGLQRGDGVDGVRAAQGLRCCFAEADVADLALLDELGQRADRLLDGDVGIDAM